MRTEARFITRPRKHSNSHRIHLRSVSRGVAGFALGLPLALAAPRAAVAGSAAAIAPATAAITPAVPAPVAPVSSTAPAAPAPVPDLSGIWILDRQHSDDPGKLRGPGGRVGTRRGGEMGFGERGRMGEPRREGGAAAEGEGGHMRSMRNPQPEKLTLFSRGDEVQFFVGPVVERTLSWGAAPDSGNVLRARWERGRLIAESPGFGGGPQRESYETSSDRKTLTVVLDVERPGGELVEMRSRYTRYDGE